MLSGLTLNIFSMHISSEGERLINFMRLSSDSFNDPPRLELSILF